MHLIETVTVEGLGIHRLTMREAVRACAGLLAQDRTALVVTPNVDHFVRWRRDADFRQAYAAADLVVPDGTPLVWLSQLQNPDAALPERIPGVDLVWQLCQHVGSTARLFILGSDERSAELASRRLTKEFGVQIAGHLSPQLPTTMTESTELDEIINALTETRPDIVLLAFGSPKQELLYGALASRVDRGLFIACGATVEFFAGTRTRAPLWMQSAGLEWLFRLAMEPRRLWRRYLITDAAILPILVRAIVRRVTARSGSPGAGGRRPPA